ncbi:hypothetical protein [Spirosoma agri]|uniref:DUF2961 domain-containing protein n=1 Tax=Spirosoma agri TaxID=1987381 RepID=A0A6M0IJ60_9BACT|nr:hypothetical protein [Spirosoma agri]NEU68298.1 hypothetical protein [Spirosoma agri]
MKKLLTLLSVLCLTLSGLAPRGLAQTVVPVEFYIYKPNAPSVELYRVIAQRNLTTYPYTVSKNNEFKAAVANGTIARVTKSGGCPLPSGKAPIVEPTCSTTATGPAFASATYSFSPNSLTVNATVSLNSGDNVKMRFENADGSSFTINNPDGVPINNTTFYFGSEPTSNTRRWIVNLPNGSAKKITIRKESDQVTFSKTFTPVSGARDVALFNATSTTVTQPPSQTTTNPGSNTATTTAGYGNAYELNSTYVALSETGRSGSGEANGAYNRVYLDPPTSGGVRIGLNLTGAGFLDYLSVSSAYNGKNQVNSPIWGNGILDAGRQVQMGAYSTPRGAGDEYTEAGQVTHGIGWNPIEGGNEGSNGDFSPLLTFHKSTGKLYTKAQPYQWDMSRVLGKMYMEKWLRHDPNDASAFRMHMRWTMFRDDAWSNSFPDVRTQETPCFMLVPDFTTVMYATGKPYTGNWISRNQPEDDGGATQFRSTEPCMAAIDNRIGKGWGLYMPFSGRWAHDNDRKGADTGIDKDFALFYVGSAPHLILDHKDAIYDLDFAAKYGTVDEIKAWCYAQPRWTGKFDYVFNQRSRLGWYYNHAGDQLEKNITDYLEVVPLLQGDQQGKDMKASSPEQWINGEFVKKIYIDAEFVNGASQMKIVWSNPDNPSVERSRDFSINPNAGRQTYTVDMTNVSGWDGSHMLGFSIQYKDPNGDGQYPSIGGVKWKIYRIRSDQ